MSPPLGIPAAHKVIALGDVHGRWAEVWGALRAAGVAGGVGEPTRALLEGTTEVVLIGDLVHYKDSRSYAQAVAEEVFDAADSRHLRRAAKAQMRELYRFKGYMDRSGAVSVILGNHDEAALTRRYTLSTQGGLEHNEFDPDKGGLELPDELAGWLARFPRQKVIGGVQFAHAGPLPGMGVYDTFFYGDPDTKRWWRDKPELARQSGCRFGVYGHTVMPEGIYLDKVHLFAMIDALDKRQFLELTFAGDDLHAEVKTF